MGPRVGVGREEQETSRAGQRLGSAPGGLELRACSSCGNGGWAGGLLARAGASLAEGGAAPALTSGGGASGGPAAGDRVKARPWMCGDLGGACWVKVTSRHCVKGCGPWGGAGREMDIWGSSCCMGPPRCPWPSRVSPRGCMQRPQVWEEPPLPPSPAPSLAPRTLSATCSCGTYSCLLFQCAEHGVGLHGCCRWLPGAGSAGPQEGVLGGPGRGAERGRGGRVGAGWAVSALGLCEH